MGLIRQGVQAGSTTVLLDGLVNVEGGGESATSVVDGDDWLAAVADGFEETAKFGAEWFLIHDLRLRGNDVGHGETGFAVDNWV
jgi:hypothetical protein